MAYRRGVAVDILIEARNGSTARDDHCTRDEEQPIPVNRARPVGIRNLGNESFGDSRFATVAS
jgi:hypothetical protein